MPRSRRRRDDDSDYDYDDRPRRRSAAGAGFGLGFGCVFGVLFAVILIVGGIIAVCGFGLFRAGKDIDNAIAEESTKRSDTSSRKTEEQRPVAKIDLDSFSQIKEGMTYEQVKEIIGVHGTENAKSGPLQTISWEDKLRFRVITITFENGRVAAKAQLGL
jgi:hypothetical protein